MSLSARNKTGLLLNRVSFIPELSPYFLIGWFLFAKQGSEDGKRLTQAINNNRRSEIVSVSVWLTIRRGAFPTGLRMVSKRPKLPLDLLVLDAQRPAVPPVLTFFSVHVSDAGPVFVLIHSYAPLGMVRFWLPAPQVIYSNVFNIDDFVAGTV